MIKDDFMNDFNSSIVFELNSFEVYPDRETEIALFSLGEHFYDSLTGNLSPRYYLSSLDPGSGKTQAIATFIKVWKSKGFTPDGSILIGLRSKREIAALVKRLGLEQEDFACFTRDKAINALGRGDDQRHRARVLITTQQMIIRRTEDRSFAAAHDFYFEGNPRPLHIWDESFVPAESVTLKGSALSNVILPLERQFPLAQSEIDKLITAMRTGEIGSIVRVPSDLKELLGAPLKAAEQRSLVLSGGQRATLEALRLGAGQPLRIIPNGGTGGRSLVGASRAIPSDFKPLIITDASGRVRDTYKIMDEAGELVRLPAKANDYRNMHIHLWARSAGREYLRQYDHSRTILNEVAGAMKGKPGEPWLVISYQKTGELDVEVDLRASLPPGFQFEYLHWGAHFALNRFSTIKNIVVIGSYLYGADAYKSLAIAATGLPADQVDLDRLPDLKPSEFQHNILQAVMRGNARNSENGVAGECDVYIVASKNPAPAALLRATFPGCQIELWGPPSVLTGNKDRLVKFLRNFFSNSNNKKIQKKQVALHLEYKNKSEMSRSLADIAVRDALHSLGISVETNYFRRW